MQTKFAYDIDTALQGARPATVYHKSTGFPDSVAEGHLREIFTEAYISDLEDGVDDNGRPLPLPILREDHLRRYWAEAKRKADDSDDLYGPAFRGHGSPRAFKALKYLDNSIILMEKLKSGYAVLPIALFQIPGQIDKTAHIEDFNLYADAMRRLPRCIKDLFHDPVDHASPDRVIPHWQPFWTELGRAPRTTEAFRALSDYYGLRALSVVPEASIHIALMGRAILRDGTTSPAQIEINPTKRVSDEADHQLALLAEEFTAAINHERYASEWDYLIPSSHFGIRFGDPLGRGRKLLYSNHSCANADPPTAHEIIEITHQAAQWLNPKS